ncbi:MAG: hypothetical protein WBX15_02045 [Thermoanaerobaculia bacterium]
MAKIRAEAMTVRYSRVGESIRCTIGVDDPAALGRAATLRICRKVEVHDSRAVNESDTVFETKIPSLESRNEIVIPSGSQFFTYHGTKIDIAIRTEIEVDDALLFDTKISREEMVSIGLKPEVSTDAKEIVEPKDVFNFIENFKAIPPKNRMIVSWLMVVGAVVIAFNSWVGWHDQWVPEPMTWFYSQHNSKGESSPPLQKSLMGSGAAGAAVWFAIRRQLRKYMSFDLCAVPGQIGRTDSIPASKLVIGRSRVPLENVTIRVAACNMEKGQYKRGSGTKERTVSFTEPVRAVILYERTFTMIPANIPVEQYLDGPVSFEPMFRVLYPPQQTSSTHGLTVHWEVQLLSDVFVDQEVVGSSDCFKWEDFLEA